MEATKVFTVQYLKELIKNQIKNGLPLQCPDGCNPKQYSKLTQTILKQTLE